MNPDLRRYPLTVSVATIAFVILALVASTTGCRRVNEITVSPPQPSETPAAGVTAVRGSVGLELKTSTAPLPPYLQSTRFRITEIRFHPEEGDWVRRLSDRTTYIADDAPRSLHTLLRTEIPVTRYDSLSIFLSDVFIQFSEHAGGPVTIERNPITIPLDFTPDNVRHRTLLLLYEPAASVIIDTSAALPQWRFSGRFTVVPDTSGGAAN